MFLFPLQHLVEIVKRDAYKNMDNLTPIDEALLNSLSLEACLKASGRSDAPVQGLQYVDASTAQGICNGMIFGNFIFVLSYTASLVKTLKLQRIQSLTKGKGRSDYAI